MALPVAAALLAYILATFSSPVALVLPVLIVALDLLGGGPAAGIARRRGIVWLLFAAASAPAIAVSLAAAAPAASRNPWLAERAFLEGLRSVFVPFPLPYHRILGPAAGFDPLWVPAALAAAAILGAARDPVHAGTGASRRGRGDWRLRGRAGDRGDGSPSPRPWHLPVLLTATALFAAARFPAAPAGPAVPYPLADHSLYLASAGACWLLVGLLDLAVSLAGARRSPARERAGMAAALVLAAVFGYTLSLRHAAFANDLAFFTAAAAEHPGSAPLRAELARAQASRAQALSARAALGKEARAQLEQAIGSVRRQVEENPSDPALRLYLANLLRDARDLDAAEKEALEALRIEPLLASAQVTIGLIRRERGDVPGAEAAYREAIRLDPALAEAHSNLGAILAARGSAAEALAELRKAVALDPSLGDAAANLASFLIEQHKPEEAMAVLRQGLLWSETNARLHYNLGVLFQSQGDRTNAVKAYENAIRLDSGYARPKNNLATLYADMGRLDEAIALLREVVAQEPGNERAHYNLGVAFRAKGDTKEAANEFAAALRINPGYAEAGRALTALVSPSGTRP